MSTRKEILEKLSAGEIDVTQATSMLNGVREPHSTGREGREVVKSIVSSKGASAGGRWLRIHVNDLESGRSRVRVNVPLGLVKLGMKVGARFTDEVSHEVMQEVMSALQDHEIVGTLVEVEDEEDNEHVHIFVD